MFYSPCRFFFIDAFCSSPHSSIPLSYFLTHTVSLLILAPYLSFFLFSSTFSPFSFILFHSLPSSSILFHPLSSSSSIFTSFLSLPYSLSSYSLCLSSILTVFLYSSLFISLPLCSSLFVPACRMAGWVGAKQNAFPLC